MSTPSTFTAPPPQSPPPPPPRTLLLTVGSTSFTPLVTSFLSTSVLTTLSSLGIESVVAQIGNSDLPTTSAKPGSTSADDEAWVVGSNRLVVQGRELEVEVLRFSNDLESKVGASDWVVAHAGAGSILSFIRPVPINTNTTTPTPRPDSVQRKLFLVPNSTLMDSHQSDLADEFERYDWVEVIRDPENLDTVFKEYLNSSPQTSKNASTTTTTKATSTSTPIPPFDPFKIRTILDQVVGYV